MWTLDRITGDAGEVHARIPAADLGPTVWLIRPRATALVLGSTQSSDDVDDDACRRAGVDVVRRRSGGGAVLVVPGEILWVDVIVPAHHPAWTDDVVRSGWWLGDVWRAALGDLGRDDTTVHHGGLVHSAWSRQVCFAGVGPGEVMVGGRKLVGISQRRNRTHARFQCALHHAWQPDTMVSLLHAGDHRGGDEQRAALHDVVATSDLDDDAIVAALMRRLDDQPASGR